MNVVHQQKLCRVLHIFAKNRNLRREAQLGQWFDLCLESMCIKCACFSSACWVFSGYSGFPQQLKGHSDQAYLAFSNCPQYVNEHLVMCICIYGLGVVFLIFSCSGKIFICIKENPPFQLLPIHPSIPSIHNILYIYYI